MRIWGQPEPGEVESGQDINALNPEASNETKGRKKWATLILPQFYVTL